MDRDDLSNLAICISMAGIVGSLLGVKKGFLLGITVTWIGAFGLFVVMLSYMEKTQSFIRDLSKTGVMIATLLLFSFYIYLVWKNNDYIVDDKMPNSWYLFSYFVVITMMGILASLYTYMQTKNQLLNVLAAILCSVLFGFVVIEKIIGTYYRTDGFRMI